TDPNQTLIGEMVQNQNAHKYLPTTARKLVEQVALPPGNGLRQSAWPRRKNQPGHQCSGKPSRNFPAQTAVSSADFNEAYPIPARCTRLLRDLPGGAAQRASHPSDITHQGIDCH